MTINLIARRITAPARGSGLRTGIAVAVTITCSGLVYLLLVASLAAAAGPALVLLLAFMTGCGIMIGMRTDPRDR